MTERKVRSPEEERRVRQLTTTFAWAALGCASIPAFSAAVALGYVILRWAGVLS